MKNSEKKLGVSLWVLGMLMSGEAAAQTCVIPPTCEELGYDKVASDCGSLAKLKCPFDDSKYFCTAYTDSNGAKIAEIGDIVYTDAISAEPIPGRIPVGIVYDLSGKMLSLSRFSGSLASPCSSYAPDGVGSWSLPTIEDMALIKANVTKINSQLAKIANTYQIETVDTNGYTDNSRMWKTTGEYGACMMSNVAITGTANYGCYRRNTPEKALCIRSFGSGGAGSSPAVGLALGDDYKDDTGTIIGTVITINGDKGVIINRVTREGTRNEAISYCEQLKTGGLTWFLPSFEQMVKVCETKAYGYSYGTPYWISDSGYYIQSTSTRSCPSTSNNVSTTLGSQSYFCAAAF